MTIAEWLLIGTSVAVGLGSLAGALLAWRALDTVGRGLRAIERSLPARTIELQTSATYGRQLLVRANAMAEHATWIAASSDERIERLRADLAAQRAASDTLRRTLIANRANVARIRDLARMRVRMIEMRRDYLG